MADWQPAPTYDMPVRFDPIGAEAQALAERLRTSFSPIWLDWFLQIQALLTAVGAGGGSGIDHNLLSNLQGGTTDQYYHMTAAEHAVLTDVATQRVLGRNSGGTGDPEELTISTVLDWISSTRGTVLYRGAAGWAALAPGTSGQVLQTQGAGADPIWATINAEPSPDDPHYEPVTNGDPAAPEILFDSNGDVVMAWVS